MLETQKIKVEIESVLRKSVIDRNEGPLTAYNPQTSNLIVFNTQ